MELNQRNVPRKMSHLRAIEKMMTVALMKAL